MTELKYEHFKKVCQAVGLKITNQRYIVLKILVESAEHPTADRLLLLATNSLPGLGRDTVYRTLNTLIERGLVRKLVMPGGATHFDGNITPHHHFLCEACGKIFDLSWPAFENLPLPREASQMGQINSVSVLVRGVCRYCRENTAH